MQMIKKHSRSFLKIKHRNKVRLAKYIKEHNGIDVESGFHL